MSQFLVRLVILLQMDAMDGLSVRGIERKRENSVRVYGRINITIS